MSKWQNKNVLVMGDSITSDGRWQKEFARRTGANIKTHAYGGIGLIDMIDGLGAYDALIGGDMQYDPFTGCTGPFKPLSYEEVEWADLIIILGAYNERHMEYGERGDMFPHQNTLRGKYAYVIEHLYAMLDKVDNLDCRVMIAAPHCPGKYDWIDSDGYEDFPKGSGRSLETMADLIKTIAGEYNLPCCDLWHTSGIGKFTWKIYANSPVAINPDYDPSKEYVAPYPQYADQAHMNDRGYARLGSCIAAFAETI